METNMIFDLRINNKLVWWLTETTEEKFIEEVSWRLEWLVADGKIAKGDLSSNILNALTLSLRLFPEGGQVTNGTLSIQYGESVKGIRPDFFFDSVEYLESEARYRYEELLDAGDIDDGTTFEEFLSGYELDSIHFDRISEGFEDFLKTYIGKSFMYNHYDKNFEFVILDDDDSLNEFIYNLNGWTTKGYRYTDDFYFYGDSVVATVDLTYSKGYHRDEVYEQENKDYLELLQKMAALQNEHSGYTFKDCFGAYSYSATIVTDYYWYAQNTFFKLYFEEYGYLEALSIDLSSLSKEEQDLSYYVACQCLELTTSRYDKIVEEYYEKVAS